MTKVAQGTLLSSTKAEGHVSNWEPVELKNVLPPSHGGVGPLCNKTDIQAVLRKIKEIL